MLRSTAASKGQQARKRGEFRSPKHESIVSLTGDLEILPPEPVRSLPNAHPGFFAYFSIFRLSFSCVCGEDLELLSWRHYAACAM
jgi:hypothetical protein